jgi:hypothetical protein
MDGRPLLILPRPQVAEREKPKTFGKPFHIPPHALQSIRITPQFQRLLVQFRSGRAEIHLDPAGAPPEQVIVLETVGAVEEFVKAVKKTGMEWLGEFEEYEIPPDEDFFRDEEHRDAELTGRLYLVMTDQQAIRLMLSLWNHYRKDRNYKFPRGLTKWRDVFKHLKDVRLWGVEDRLRNTGALEDWRRRVEQNQERIRFEVELWYRGEAIKRDQARTSFLHLMQQQGGRIIEDAVIPEIAYHGILAELPIGAIRQVLAQRDVQFLRSQHVMFFRPVGQSVVSVPQGEALDMGLRVPETLPAGDPVVGVLDGLPLSNHRLLSNSLIIDDPDDLASVYSPEEQIHGTSMTSLILHGELDTNGPALRSRLYVRPILRPDPTYFGAPKPESMPDETLAVDLIHRSVKRMFEAEHGQQPTAPTVKFVNFSIGDPTRLFDYSMSSLARLIDWLSFKYNVLFIVSAGNHPREIVLDHPRAQFENLSAADREKKVLQSIASNSRYRRLLSPAESLNSLTVGAIHEDSSPLINLGSRVDPHNIPGLPSPVNALGLGYRRAVKPDILMPGGRQLYGEKIGTHEKTTLEISYSSLSPGLKSAAPGRTPGDLNGTRYSRGTSNATALATRAAAQLYEMLRGLREETGADMLEDEFIPVLTKALLVHGARWGDVYDRLSELLVAGETQGFREQAVRFLGYGRVYTERLLGCTVQRATLIGSGQLYNEQAHVYSIPLPPSLNGILVRKRLTITLAWLTPIRSSTRAYRSALLWFDPPASSLGLTRMNVDGRAVRRGTVQHEVLEGERATVFVEGDVLVIKVNCREDAKPLESAVRYGIVATLEVAEDIEIPLYEEIRFRIQPRIRIEPET